MTISSFVRQRPVDWSAVAREVVSTRTPPASMAHRYHLHVELDRALTMSPASRQLFDGPQYELADVELNRPAVRAKSFRPELIPFYNQQYAVWKLSTTAPWKSKLFDAVRNGTVVVKDGSGGL